MGFGLGRLNCLLLQIKFASDFVTKFDSSFKKKLQYKVFFSFVWLMCEYDMHNSMKYLLFVQ